MVTQPPIQWVPRAFPKGVERPGHKTKNSLPFSAKNKRWWS